jgi:hypothetical protein
MNPVFVRGLGLWTPGFPSPGAWCLGDSDPGVTEPAPILLTGSLKRRSSLVTRIAVETYVQAAAHAGCRTDSVPTVWATAHGEHSTALNLLEMMNHGDGKVSPAKFHSSVHNTPGGYASIAAGNVAQSTTLTGGSELVSAALIETMCLVESIKSDVIVVFADEALKPPFDVPGSGPPLAVAFCLGNERDGALAQISCRLGDGPALPLDERFGFLHVSAALPLLERIVNRLPGPIALEFEASPTGVVWTSDVEPFGD